MPTESERQIILPQCVHGHIVGGGPLRGVKPKVACGDHVSEFLATQVLRRPIHWDSHFRNVLLEVLQFCACREKWQNLNFKNCYPNSQPTKNRHRPSGTSKHRTPMNGMPLTMTSSPSLRSSTGDSPVFGHCEFGATKLIHSPLCQVGTTTCSCRRRGLFGFYVSCLWTTIPEGPLLSLAFEATHDKTDSTPALHFVFALRAA